MTDSLFLQARFSVLRVLLYSAVCARAVELNSIGHLVWEIITLGVQLQFTGVCVDKRAWREQSPDYTSSSDFPTRPHYHKNAYRVYSTTHRLSFIPSYNTDLLAATVYYPTIMMETWPKLHPIHPNTVTITKHLISYPRLLQDPARKLSASQ